MVHFCDARDQKTPELVPKTPKLAEKCPGF